MDPPPKLPNRAVAPCFMVIEDTVRKPVPAPPRLWPTYPEPDWNSTAPTVPVRVALLELKTKAPPPANVIACEVGRLPTRLPLTWRVPFLMTSPPENVLLELPLSWTVLVPIFVSVPFPERTPANVRPAVPSPPNVVLELKAMLFAIV